MQINEVFQEINTFTAEVEFVIPRKDGDQKFTATVEYRYLDQDQIDALIDGESVVIGDETVEAGDDISLLDIVLVGWKNWKVKGEELEYNEENHAQALNHAPIRSPMVDRFFKRLAGGEGGTRGRRKKRRK